MPKMWRDSNKLIVAEININEEEQLDSDILLEYVPVCPICKKRKASVMHHINLDKSDNRPENLISICRECHGYIHGLLNACLGTIANQREVLAILTDKGYSIFDIIVALERFMEQIQKMK
jgi:hypothetical protein